MTNMCWQNALRSKQNQINKTTTPRSKNNPYQGSFYLIIHRVQVTLYWIFIFFLFIFYFFWTLPTRLSFLYLVGTVPVGAPYPDRFFISYFHAVTSGFILFFNPPSIVDGRARDPPASGSLGSRSTLALRWTRRKLAEPPAIRSRNSPRRILLARPLYIEVYARASHLYRYNPPLLIRRVCRHSRSIPRSIRALISHSIPPPFYPSILQLHRIRDYPLLFFIYIFIRILFSSLSPSLSRKKAPLPFLIFFFIIRRTEARCITFHDRAPGLLLCSERFYNPPAPFLLDSMASTSNSMSTIHVPPVPPLPPACSSSFLPLSSFIYFFSSHSPFRRRCRETT